MLQPFVLEEPTSVRMVYQKLPWRRRSLTQGHQHLV